MARAVFSSEHDVSSLHTRIGVGFGSKAVLLLDGANVRSVKLGPSLRSCQEQKRPSVAHGCVCLVFFKTVLESITFTHFSLFRAMLLSPIVVQYLWVSLFYGAYHERFFTNLIN